nr:iron chaperone [Bacillus sp. JCM 19034]
MLEGKSAVQKGGHNLANFTEFLQGIDHETHKERTEQIFNWITEKYPKLETGIKWKQPMFTDHGTFIIGFSVSKKHLSVAPEQVAISHVEEDIQKAGYEYTKEIIRIPWNREVDYELLEKMIDFNIWDKANCTTFWRK